MRQGAIRIYGDTALEGVRPSAHSPVVPFARKLILHVPISDESLLDGFVEQCLNDGVTLLAVVGPGCARVEDMIDDIIVGDCNGEPRFICTTSHPDEPFDDVLAMVETWELERGDPFQEVRL